MTPPLLLRLREETRPLHEQVERAVDVLRRTATQTDYRGLLAEFLGIVEPLEARLSQVPGLPEALPDWPCRRRAPWLLQDLAALGLAAEQRDALPRCASLPELRTLADAFGCLYVLEGSTLGGQFIARRVQDQLRLTASTGLAYFTGHGDRTGLLWRQFGDAVGRFAAGRECDAPVLETAAATFHAFRGWFARNP